MNIIRPCFAAFACLLSACASTNDRWAENPELLYGDCDVIELERITRKLAREKYSHRKLFERFPFGFIDLGDRLRFFTHYPPTWAGGSPTTEFDKETCELIRIYETE